MWGRRPSALVVLLALTVAAGVSAQSGGASGWKHPLTDPPPPAPGVEVLYWFPDHGRLQFPVGDKIDVVLGFHNGGDEPLNVSYIMGSINSPAVFSLYVHNLTAQVYGVVVPPGEDASLQYSFTPNKALHPREFYVALTAFYSNAAGEEFSTTFFNKTSDIVEAPSLVDFELLGLYVGFAAVLAGLGYMLFKWLSGFSWFRAQLRKRPSKAPVAPAAPEAGSQNEWLKGTYYKGPRQYHAGGEVKKTS